MPVSGSVLAAFVAACVLLALTPGPNMSLIVANTLASGRRAGIITLAGTGTGLAILVTLASAGMSSLMMFMSQWFDWVRLAGAIYLSWLGARQLWRCWRRRASGLFGPQGSAGGWYIQGLLVSLSNPKALLFLGAFLPQFVDLAGNPLAQLAILSVVFVITLVAVDLGYTLLVARARAAFDARSLGLLDGAAGVLLVVGGLVLATVRRP